MAIIEIWINCPDAVTARNISEALLSKKLIACANLYPEIKSVYPWKGELEAAREIPLCLKTRKSLFDAVAAIVKELHPYEVPSIKALEADEVNEEYEKWVFEETIEPSAGSIEPSAS